MTSWHRNAKDSEDAGLLKLRAFQSDETGGWVSHAGPWEFVSLRFGFSKSVSQAEEIERRRKAEEESRAQRPTSRDRGLAKPPTRGCACVIR